MQTKVNIDPQTEKEQRYLRLLEQARQQALKRASQSTMSPAANTKPTTP
jgi:hypothetical protein